VKKMKPGRSGPCKQEPAVLPGSSEPDLVDGKSTSCFQTSLPVDPPRWTDAIVFSGMTRSGITRMSDGREAVNFSPGVPPSDLTL